MSIRKTFHFRPPLVALLTASAFYIPAPAQPTPLTARQVIERIEKNVGVPWQEKTVDTFKAGDPDAPVTGIATTMMATYDVLQRAAAAHCNLVITHEPTFYSHLDQTETLAGEHDAVYAAKQNFIREHHLVVWRFHDHWHMRRPDGITQGMVRALGWQKYQDAANPLLFVVPETTLERFAGDIARRLDIGALRVVGDPAMMFTRVGLSPGAPGTVAHRHMLQMDAVEVMVMGEAQEWETIEYGADAVAEGKHKALVILGHIPSEQSGMEDCATWLRTFVTEVPVQFVAAAEPFWIGSPARAGH